MVLPKNPLLAVALCGGAFDAFAQTAAPPVDYGALDLEQLAQIKITTVSKRPQSVRTAPAAVAVVTADDLAQTGATTVPEALQWVPGLNVAQISADNWAIGARGFQWQYANKLLVMVDGRSVYSPVGGGVRWEDTSVMLDDLDRIEVVRGPGSSLWGANAVNGVINVVSRSAFDTLGSRLVAATGNEVRVHAAARQGVALGTAAALRVYGLHRGTDDNALPAGGAAGDAAEFTQGGFRGDWRPTAADTVTLQGDAFSSESAYTRTLTTLAAPPTYAVVSTAPITARGANLLGKWRRERDAGTFFEWQTYADWSERWRPQNRTSVRTLDTTFEFGAAVGERHEITAGAGYRALDGRITDGYFHYDPGTLHPRLFSSFVQDTITLEPGRWTLTAGTKYEHHSFTGGSVQPTLRLSFTPSPDLFLWAACGRAVRNPTWSEEVSALDARVTPPTSTSGGLPVVLRIQGNRDLRAERLVACELGARWRINQRLSADLALFSYDYRDYVQISFTTTAPQSAPPALIRAAQYTNGIRGESYGGELALRADLAPWWKLAASHSYVDIQLHTTMSDPFGYEQDETTTPDHVTRLQSDVRLGPRWNLNLSARHVGAVRYYGIPAYTELDARLAFRLRPGCEIGLAGRNLLDAQHAEYDSALNRRLTEIQRSVLLLVRHDF